MLEERIKTILVSGSIVNQFKEAMLSHVEKVDGKQFRYREENELMKEDFEWADAYVNFRPSLQFCFGNLKWIHSLGAGVDSFVNDKEWKTNVLLTRTICSFGERISEYCLYYMLQELQGDCYFQIAKKEKEWKPLTPGLIKDQKVILFGTGEIGQVVATNFSRLGAKVIGVSKSGKSKKGFHDVVRVNEINGLFEAGDWIINTLPLTKETAFLFNKELFQKMVGIFFINVGRGYSVDEMDLIRAIKRGNVKKAILDVFQQEPLPKDSPLWGNDQIVVTPHISAVTTPEEAVECFLATLENIENGRSLPNKVNVLQGY